MEMVQDAKGKTYTAEEIVQFTINILSGIKVPAAGMEEIGMPVFRSLQNLMVVKEMLEKERVAREVMNEPVEEEKEDGREADSE